MSYATRVRAGVALLDEKMPGWHERIDLRELDMAFGDACVLGQLFGSFFLGARKLSFDRAIHDSAPFGFAEPDEFVVQFKDNYPLLDRLWRYVVKQRQAAAA